MKIIPNNIGNWCIKYSSGLYPHIPIEINITKSKAEKLAQEWDLDSDRWTSYIAREQTPKDIEDYKFYNSYEYSR